MKSAFPILLWLVLLTLSDYSHAAAWTEKSNFPATARHRTTAFSIGNKGYLGLGHHNSGPLGNVLYDDIWEYDPSTDSWTQVADFAGGKRYHVHDFVANGKAYLIGGRSYVDTVYFNDMWEYDPISNSWSSKPSLPALGRIGAQTFTFGEYGVITMGLLQGGFLDNLVYAYHFETETWYSAPAFPGPPRLSGVSFVIGNNAYIATGYGYIGSMNDCWKLDSATWTWTEIGTIGDTLRGQSHGFSINGKGYVVAGNSWELDEDYGDMWELEPTTDTWKKVADFPGLKRRYMDGFEIHNRAYMGVGTNGTNLKDWWEYDPQKAVGLPEQGIEINVYPNPASEIVHFSIPEGKNYTVEIIDSKGSSLVKKNINNKFNYINLYNCNSGLYNLIILDDSKLICSKRLVVQN